MKNSFCFFVFVFFLFSVYAQPNDNAAVGYWKIFSEMNDLSQEMTHDKIEETIKKGLKLEQPLLENLRSNRYAIKQAIKLSRLEKCSFILEIEWDEGAELILPHLAKARVLGKILVLDGMRCAEEGKWEEAAERYIASLRLGYLLNQDNVLISSLVMQSIVRLALLSIENMIANDKAPLPFLEKIKKNMDAISSMNMEKAIASENCLFTPYKIRLQSPQQAISVLMNIRNLGSETEKEQEELKKILEKFADSTPQQRQTISQKLCIPLEALASLQTLSGYLRKGMDDYSIYIEKFLQCYKQPYKVGIENIKKLETEAKDANMVVKSTLPAVSKLYNKHYSFMAYFKMVGTGIDLKIYHRTKGNFPTNLKELQAEPYKDPFTDQDFQYHTRDGKAFLQSAGEEVQKLEIK